MIIKQLKIQRELLLQFEEDKKNINNIEQAIKCITIALKNDRPLLICGNGGSAADTLHIAGELVGRFLKERPALNVISLNANVSVLTAWANDYSYDSAFARQVEAHGCEGGVLWGISTSGNSDNVIQAMNQAHKQKMLTIGLVGKGGGKMAELCDTMIDVPSNVTPRVQELHLPIYHYICEQVENNLC